jgi:hypothetical protein
MSLTPAIAPFFVAMRPSAGRVELRRRRAVEYIKLFVPRCWRLHWLPEAAVEGILAIEIESEWKRGYREMESLVDTGKYSELGNTRYGARIEAECVAAKHLMAWP